MPITRDLSNFYVSQSFQRLAQLDPNDNKSLLFGTGSYVADLKITGSLEISSKLKTNLPDASQISIYIHPSTTRPIIENETAPATASLQVLESGINDPVNPPVFGGISALGTLYINTTTGDLFVYTLGLTGSRSLPSSFISEYLIGDGVLSSYNLAHTFGYRDVGVSLFDSSNAYDELYATIYYQSTASVTLDFSPTVLQLNEISASVLNYTTTSYSQVIGNNIDNSFAINHNFATREAMVFIRQSGSVFENVIPDIFYSSSNSINVQFPALIPNTNEYVVTVVPFTSSLGATYSKNIGDGASLSYVVQHNLNTKHVFVVVRENSAPYERIYPEIYHDTKNRITIGFSSAPTTNQYKVNILG